MPRLIDYSFSSRLIILDFDYHTTSLNPAVKSILEANPMLQQQLSHLTAEQDKLIKSGGANQYRCTLSSFIDRGFPHPFILIED